MTRYRNEYERWLQFADKATVEELKSLEGQEEQLEYRFSKNLDFGTAGLRGVMMAGLNAMNVYTVGAATQGFGSGRPGCAHRLRLQNPFGRIFQGCRRGSYREWH